MHAAVLEQFGRPLTVRELPDPEPHGGEVLVEVLATRVLPYSAEIFSGERRYPLVPPVVPGLGGIARIRALGPDATRLHVGDLVHVDPTVRSRDDVTTPDITLQGWSSRGDGGAALARHFHDGSFAELMAVPTENVFPIGDVPPERWAQWTSISIYLVPYGGLLDAGLAAGETLLVNGATGNFGSAGVAVGLAMGAARVVAVGRNAAILDELSARHGDRVRAVRLTGEQDADHRAMLAAADGRVDVVLDLLPPAAGVGPVRAAAMTVREFGRVVLMGGVGMLGGDDLALPYPWLMRNSVTVRGRWMCDRSANPRMIELVRAGLIDIDRDAATTFRLPEVNEAVAHAAAHGGAFARTVLLPSAA